MIQDWPVLACFEFPCGDDILVTDTSLLSRLPRFGFLRFVFYTDCLQDFFVVK